MNEKNTPAVVSNTTAINLFDKDQFEQLQRMARMFATSDLVPDIYKATTKENENKAISNCVIAINIANRLNADILAVMQNMAPIYGKPSWASKFLIGLVNSCGRFEMLQFRKKELDIIENYKYTEYESEWLNNRKQTKLVNKVFQGPVQNIECIAYTYPKGAEKTPDTILEGNPVTIRMAIDEGWYTKKGSKWPNIPLLMLIYRAASFWVSQYAPDLTLGMPTMEEARDIIDVDYEDVSTPKKQAEQIINEKANKQPLDFDEPKPSQPEPAQQKTGEQTLAKPKEEQPENGEGPLPLNVANLDDARTYLVDNHGLKRSDLLGEKVIEVATELGYKINLP